MTIISTKFFLFVFGLLIIYYLLPKQIRWWALLLGSSLFYYLSVGKYIIFIIASIISVFVLSLGIDNINHKIKELEKDKKDLKEQLLRRKKLFLLIGIILNLLLIIVTKYFDFALTNLNGILSIFGLKRINPIFHLLLPLGISYYTLEAISYITDVYRGKYSASHNIFKVALYLLYFPKITEGPFVRFNELYKEIDENNDLDFNNILIGLDLVIIGLFKKMVIADRAGIYVNNVFNTNIGGFSTIVAMILYTIQIYAEFSGTIDIIRGISFMFGIKLPTNFKRPFLSKSVQEFWTRWHISLGSWIKEYVFFPISLSKMNRKVVMFSKKHLSNYLYTFICSAFPLFFVWLVNGLWHGASYKYIAYGMYYYLIMMVGLLLAPLSKKMRDKIKINKKIWDILSIGRTLILLVIGMTLFRATSLNDFFATLKSIFSQGTGILELGLTRRDFALLLASTIGLIAIGLFEEKNKISLDKGFTSKILTRSVIYTILICMIVIFGIYGEGYDASNFIYGAF